MSSFVPAKVWTHAFRRSFKTRPLATTIHPSLAAVDLRRPERIARNRASIFRIMPYLLPLFVLMLRMTGAVGLRIRRRILRLRILRVRRGDLPPAQAVCAVDHNPLTDRHAGIDRCHWAIGRADIDRSDRHPVVGVDDVDVTSRCAALDGGGRHRDDIMQRLHQKLRVDELIRKQRILSMATVRATARCPLRLRVFRRRARDPRSSAPTPYRQRIALQSRERGIGPPVHYAALAAQKYRS